MEKENQIQTFNFAPKGLVGDIRDAIRNRFYININYTNKYVPYSFVGYRNIAPAVLGINKISGNLVLRAFLIRGISYSIQENISKNQWRLFLVNRISNWSVSSNVFGPLPLYRFNDKSLRDIREQLNFEEQMETFNENNESFNEEDYDWFEI